MRNVYMVIMKIIIVGSVMVVVKFYQNSVNAMNIYLSNLK